jgi:hypothetical protein
MMCDDCHQPVDEVGEAVVRRHLGEGRIGLGIGLWKGSVVKSNEARIPPSLRSPVLDWLVQSIRNKRLPDVWIVRAAHQTP